MRKRLGCCVCKKPLYRNKKYCSLKCHGKAMRKRKLLTCENSVCRKVFERELRQISPHNFCSRSCTATVNNKKFPKRIAKIRKCEQCEKRFTGGAIKYCSVKCKNKGARIPGEKLLNLIRMLHEEKGRIPFKSEFSHYRAVRRRFGTWNKAVLAAGLDPNPVMFAKKYIAKDGHKCDSLAEKIVDDWLFARKIKHKINYPYPGKFGLTVDFKVGEYWIEFLGLSGRHKRYDELKNLKLKLAKKHNLSFVSIYPHHLFPENLLDEVLIQVV